MGCSRKTTRRVSAARRSPHYACRGGASVAAHHHTQRRVPDAVQLEVEQSPGRVGGQARRLGQPLAVGHQRRPLPGRRVPDDDKAPGLGVPDRRTGVGCREHPLQRGVGHGIGAEPADVAARADDVVQRLTFVGGERPRVRRCCAGLR